MGKGTLLVLLLLLINCLCFRPGDSNSTGSPFSTASSSSGCIEEEREALLSLKQSFGSFNIERLGSWQGRDCCGWEGISCDKSTGRVLKLDLRAPDESSGLITGWLEAKEVNPSLTKLKFLKYLDLSGNDFQSSSIPRFLGQMQGLTYLNLSNANFGGIVPHHLGNLSSLEYLDLRYSAAGTTVGDFSWVSGLSSLQYLDMAGVYFDQVAPKSMQQVLSQLSSLFHLDLSSCGLNNTHLSSSASLPTTLRYLDLSDNYFYGSIPDSLQNLTSLEVLHFSASNLAYYLPSWLGNLNKIESLNISGNEFNSPDYEICSILRNLSNLCSLDLSSNQFSGSLPMSLGRYPYLSSLDLSYNQFNGIIQSSIGRLSALERLDLSHNQFIGSIPTTLGRLSALKWLDLSGNQFIGSIPTSLGRLVGLTYLDLSYNQFIGCIPTSLGRLVGLTSLDLSYNQLTGSTPTSLGRLVGLIHMDLSHNQFTGSIHTSFGRLVGLIHMDLSSNKLNGTISKSVGQLTNLTLLDLSNNTLSGAIPESLGQLVHLTSLNIDSNALEGVFSEHHLSNLSSLTTLNIGNNHLLKIRIDPNWTPPFQLYYIGMRSCKFESKEFPTWLRTQHQVNELDLSNTGISDTLPLWLLEDKFNLETLDLSSNQLEGHLPPRIQSVQVFYKFIMTDNMLNGSIPTWFCDMEYLTTLDLSKNSFSGHIPDCWVSNQTSLEVINLSFNKLIGIIPTSLEKLPSLRWLLLSNNNLIGTIPLFLSNTYLSVLDLGGNKLSANIPTWIGERFPFLRILKLRNNMFKGIIPPQLCLLSDLQILDLADNDLQGSLPTCLGNIAAMTLLESKSDFDYALAIAPISAEEWDKSNVRQVLKGRELEYTSVLKFVVNMDLSGNKLQGSVPQELTQLQGLVGLNLARNQLSGSIPDNIGDLRSLQSLDLSENHLSGAIPSTLSALTYLSYLNLSHNNLAGEIPRGNQLLTMDDPSMYQGNPDLCGPPLPQTCPGNNPTSSGTGGDDSIGEKHTSSEKMWFYLVVVAGYATGFWGVVGVLLLKKNWRHAYFLYVDELKEKIYVIVAVTTGALKKKMKKIKASQPQ